MAVKLNNVVVFSFSTTLYVTRFTECLLNYEQKLSLLSITFFKRKIEKISFLYFFVLVLGLVKLKLYSMKNCLQNENVLGKFNNVTNSNTIDPSSNNVTF